MFNTNYNKILNLEIQHYLINIRSIYPSLPAIFPTGVYDAETRNAVAAFQNIKNLPATGTVDIRTWNELLKENNEYMKKTQMPCKVPVSSPDFAEVKIGDKKDIVYSIKCLLNSFHKKFKNYYELEMTNVYDEKTEEAIRNFQQRSMLPITGTVDKQTWDKLASIFDICKFYN